MASLSGGPLVGPPPHTTVSAGSGGGGPALSSDQLRIGKIEHEFETLIAAVLPARAGRRDPTHVGGSLDRSRTSSENMLGASAAVSSAGSSQPGPAGPDAAMVPTAAWMALFEALAQRDANGAAAEKAVSAGVLEVACRAAVAAAAAGSVLHIVGPVGFLTILVLLSRGRYSQRVSRALGPIFCAASLSPACAAALLASGTDLAAATVAAFRVCAVSMSDQVVEVVRSREITAALVQVFLRYSADATFTLDWTAAFYSITAICCLGGPALTGAEATAALLPAVATLATVVVDVTNLIFDRGFFANIFVSMQLELPAKNKTNYLLALRANLATCALGALHGSGSPALARAAAACARGDPAFRRALLRQRGGGPEWAAEAAQQLLLAAAVGGREDGSAEEEGPLDCGLQHTILIEELVAGVLEREPGQRGWVDPESGLSGPTDRTSLDAARRPGSPTAAAPGSPVGPSWRSSPAVLQTAAAVLSGALGARSLTAELAAEMAERFFSLVVPSRAGASNAFFGRELLGDVCWKRPALRPALIARLVRVAQGGAAAGGQPSESLEVAALEVSGSAAGATAGAGGSGSGPPVEDSIATRRAALAALYVISGRPGTRADVEAAGAMPIAIAHLRGATGCASAPAGYGDGVMASGAANAACGLLLRMATHTPARAYLKAHKIEIVEPLTLIAAAAAAPGAGGEAIEAAKTAATIKRWINLGSETSADSLGRSSSGVGGAAGAAGANGSPRFRPGAGGPGGSAANPLLPHRSLSGSSASSPTGLIAMANALRMDDSGSEPSTSPGTPRSGGSSPAAKDLRRLAAAASRLKPPPPAAEAPAVVAGGSGAGGASGAGSGSGRSAGSSSSAGEGGPPAVAPVVPGRWSMSMADSDLPAVTTEAVMNESETLLRRFTDNAAMGLVFSPSGWITPARGVAEADANGLVAALRTGGQKGRSAAFAIVHMAATSLSACGALIRARALESIAQTFLDERPPRGAWAWIAPAAAGLRLGDRVATARPRAAGLLAALGLRLEQAIDFVYSGDGETGAYGLLLLAFLCGDGAVARRAATFRHRDGEALVDKLVASLALMDPGIQSPSAHAIAPVRRMAMCGGTAARAALHEASVVPLLSETMRWEALPIWRRAAAAGALVELMGEPEEAEEQLGPPAGGSSAGAGAGGAGAGGASFLGGGGPAGGPGSVGTGSARSSGLSSGGAESPGLNGAGPIGAGNDSARSMADDMDLGLDVAQVLAADAAKTAASEALLMPAGLATLQRLLLEPGRLHICFSPAVRALAAGARDVATRPAVLRTVVATLRKAAAAPLPRAVEEAEGDGEAPERPFDPADDTSDGASVDGSGGERRLSLGGSVPLMEEVAESVLPVLAAATRAIVAEAAAARVKPGAGAAAEPHAAAPAAVSADLVEGLLDTLTRESTAGGAVGPLLSLARALPPYRVAIVKGLAALLAAAAATAAATGHFGSGAGDGSAAVVASVLLSITGLPGAEAKADLLAAIPALTAVVAAAAAAPPPGAAGTGDDPKRVSFAAEPEVMEPPDPVRYPGSIAVAVSLAALLRLVVNPPARKAMAECRTPAAVAALLAAAEPGGPILPVVAHSAAAGALETARSLLRYLHSLKGANNTAGVGVGGRGR